MKKILPILLVGIIVLSGVGVIGSPKASVKSNISSKNSNEDLFESLLSSPPEKPTITGPSIGAENWSYCFEIVTIDPDNESVFYIVDWGDGNQSDWLGPFNPGNPIQVCHTWLHAGIYYITAKAKDEGGIEGSWSDPFEITIVENQAPLKPEINGPKSGTANQLYEWTFQSIDPDGDDMEFYICWGGTCVGRWYGPYESGEVVTKGYTYLEEGTYQIRCIPRDIYGVIGPEANFEVTMPKNKAMNRPFLQILENHIFLFPILRIILQSLEL